MMIQEVNMSFKTKVAIFLMATFISLAVFSFIAAPAVDIMKVGKKAGYNIISNVLANAEPAAHRSAAS
jgi:hypothetical protein